MFPKIYVLPVHRLMAKAISNEAKCLNKWEFNFMIDIVGSKTISLKQVAVLKKIYEKTRFYSHSRRKKEDSWTVAKYL